MSSDLEDLDFDFDNLGFDASDFEAFDPETMALLEAMDAMEDQVTRESVKPKRDPLDPAEYVKRIMGKRLLIFDSETDPFKHGSSIQPFTCGLLDCETGEYVDFWGDDCIDQFFAHLQEQYTEPGISCLVACHNWGGFDLFFMLQYLDTGTYPNIINGKVSSAWLAGQEFRDSLRIIPVSLKTYQKDDFDYRKMRREVRDKHRDEILLYQRHDCEYLAELVREFYLEFGDRPTIGNTAIAYLQSFHGFERINQSTDNLLRPFFFGGRCQHFKSGILEGPWKVFDVTSMYPHVMRSFEHPVSGEPIRGRKITDKTAFVHFKGYNYGALPIRGENGSLDFTREFGEFRCSIHEFNTAQQLGLIKPLQIIQTIGFRTWSKFDTFIDHFFEQRQIAKANDDRIRNLFYKLIMNSAYGKFAQDPRKYEKYCVTVASGIPEAERRSAENPNGWYPKEENGDTIIWARPAPGRMRGLFHVGIGASITGAARSQLMRGLHAAVDPIYCDTDSVICRDLKAAPGVVLDDNALGGWKLEAVGDVMAIAGKKLYGLYDLQPEAWKKAAGKLGLEDARKMGSFIRGNRRLYPIKKASKGVSLSGREIYHVANGGEIRYKNPVPNFSLNGRTEYVTRKIRQTG